MAGRPRRQIVVTLLPVEWDLLVAAAQRDQREPFVQARWLLLQALEAAAAGGAAPPVSELTDVA